MAITVLGENETENGILRPLEHLEMMTTSTTTGNEWKGIVNDVRYWLNKDGVDDFLPRFDEMFAKIAKREFCNRNSPVPQGVMFCGYIGNGKSVRLRFMSSHLNVKMEQADKLAQRLKGHIGDDYFLEQICADYMYPNISNKRANDFIIDDIGREFEIANTYGTKDDTMERIIDERYRAFVDHGSLTHFSTNLTEEQIKARYGERISSRLNEMCVFVKMPNLDRRRDRRSFGSWEYVF